MGGQISEAEKAYINEYTIIIKEINKRRSIVTLLNSIKFRRIWNHSTEEQKKIFVKDLKCRDIQLIKDWLNNHPSIDLEEKNIRQLRNIAKELGIRNWCRMTLVEIINAITDERKKQNENT